MARGGDENAFEQLRQHLWRSAELQSAKSAKYVFGSDVDQAMGRDGYAYREGLNIAFDLIREMVYGDGSRHYTGLDSRGKHVSVEKHFRVMFKHELIEFRFKNSHSGEYDRRTWGRFETIVKNHDEFGQLTLRAVDRGRVAVKRGDYVGTPLSISVDTYDACTKDLFGHEDLSLDRPFHTDKSTGREETYGDRQPDVIFTLEPTTPEGRIAQEALESLGPRKQAIFERANGLTGDRETLADIGNDYGLTEQRIGQIVKACKQYIAAAVEDYRFEHGLPPLTP